MPRQPGHFLFLASTFHGLLIEPEKRSSLQA
jgi:hypothetical protein